MPPRISSHPAALLLLFLALAGCSPSHDTTQPATASFQPVDVNLVSGENALREVADFLAVGPRISGTEGARRAADYLATRLTSLGLTPEIRSFEDPSPSGTTVFHNVICRIPGRSPDTIVLISHFDTKSGISDDFPGANDSGSSTGLLLELARIFSASKQPLAPSIVLAFVDGEECAVEYGPTDGLHGSRKLAAELKADTDHPVLAAIVLDMIGDRDLSVTIPRNSSPELVSMTFAAATDEGRRDKFSLFRGHILDDHVSFLDVGIPAVNLIDFEFGSRPGLNDYWHTPEDTLDKLSAESLETVGRVTLRLINRLADGL